MASAGAPVKLFVGGLTQDTQQDSVRQLFEKFGEVVKVW